MRKQIAVVSDFAVIGVALLVAFVVISNYAQPRSEPVALLKPGDTLDFIRTLGTSAAHGKRLLFVLKEGCPYCEGSAPLYKELAQLESSGLTEVKMIAVFEEPVDVARKLLSAEDIRMEVMGAVSLDRLRIAGTPTLILIDERDRVVRIWEGLLSRKAEQEIKELLTSI